MEKPLQVIQGLQKNVKDMNKRGKQTKKNVNKQKKKLRTGRQKD